MTITATPSEISYAADSITVVFPIPFPFDTAADLKLTSTDASGNILTLSTGFTISGGAGSTGNATFSVAPVTGLTITIYDNPALTQPTDYVSLDAFPAESHERALDRVTRIAKRLYQLVQRSVRFPDGDVSTDGVLSSVANRKGKYLFFNAVTGAIEYAANIVTTTLSQSIIGQLLNPQINAELVAGVVPTNSFYGPYDLRRYGADPTGVAASDTAMTQAIAVCGTTGGVIRAPAGLYSFASQINLNGKFSIIIQGDGLSTGGTQPATKFQYTGTGSGIWITMLDTNGVQFRGIQLIHSNVGFTGTYIRCGNGGTRDAIYCGVFDGTIGSTISNTVHLDLDKATNFGAENVNFIGGNPSVKGQANTGASYSNCNTFYRCQWHSSAVAPIYDLGQAWKFDSCNFEPLANNGAGAFFSSNGFVAKVNALTVINCWIGDNSGGGNWFDIAGQGIKIANNYIGGSTTSTAINLRHINGINIIGNTFAQHLSAVNFADAVMGQITIKNNVCNNVGLPTVSMPLTFTGSVGSGSTSATLSAAWTGATGAYSVGFSDAEVKSVTLTNGATTATWSGGLTNTVTANALVAAGYNVPVGALECVLNFGLTVPAGHGSTASPGFRVNTDGTVKQWGKLTVTNGTPSAVTFPLTFPSALNSLVVSLGPPNAGTDQGYATVPTTSGFTANVAGSVGSSTFHWQAEGK